MSRYIDADVLIVELQKDEERFDKEADDCRKNSRNYTDCYMQAMSSRADGIRDAIVEVYDAPSIDIVRCQDCKYWVYNFNGCARNPCTEPWYATDFCNYGERKESE